MSSNFRRTFEDLYWGADLHLLNLCVEEKSRFIRHEIGIILMSVLFSVVLIQNGIPRTGSTYVGIAIFLLYKMYLSNLNIVAKGDTQAGLKFLIGLLLACTLTYCAGIYFRLTFPWVAVETMDCIYIVLIFAVSIMLCFSPIRMSSAADTQYGKMLASEREKESALAETILSTNNIKKEDAIKTIKENAKTKEEILKAADKEYAATMAHEIAQARIRLAEFALQKWEDEQHKQIEQDIEHYIKKK